MSMKPYLEEGCRHLPIPGFRRAHRRWRRSSLSPTGCRQVSCVGWRSSGFAQFPGDNRHDVGDLRKVVGVIGVGGGEGCPLLSAVTSCSCESRVVRGSPCPLEGRRFECSWRTAKVKKQLSAVTRVVSEHDTRFLGLIMADTPSRHNHLFYSAKSRGVGGRAARLSSDVRRLVVWMASRTTQCKIRSTTATPILLSYPPFLPHTHSNTYTRPSHGHAATRSRLSWMHSCYQDSRDLSLHVH